jgi:hypothetical protein
MSLLQSSVTLRPPPGFQRSTDYQGWVDRDRGASVLVQSFPAPCHEIEAGFEPAALERQGILWLGQERARWGNEAGLVIHALQTLGEVRFIKWIALLGNTQRTFVVTASIPEALANELSRELRECLLAARVVDEPPTQLKRGFDLREMPFWQRLESPGLSVVFALAGRDPRYDQSTPLLVAMRVPGNILSEDRLEHVEARIVAVAGYTNVTIDKRRELSVDDLPGWELIATSRDANGRPAVIYQLTLFAEHDWFLMQGLCTANLAEELLPQFADLAAGFHRDPAAE